jgi:hypothetical protein
MENWAAAGKPLLPGAFDTERGEVGGFGLVEVVLDHMIHTRAARAAAEAAAQFVQVLGVTGRNHLQIAIFSVADPALQFQFARFALDEPAEADPLNAATDKKVKNHTSPV